MNNFFKGISKAYNDMIKDINDRAEAVRSLISPDNNTDKTKLSECSDNTESSSCAFPDEFYLTPNEIYVPDSLEAEKAKVPYIELTEKQAIEQGWSFQKKSKAVRITNYHGKERDIIIPSKIGGMRVNELSKRAFMHTNIDRVQIPKCIKKAGKELFYLSKVREVIFAGGLRVIPKDTFFKCEELSRVILPDTVFEIESRAFYDCRALEYIRFPDSLFKVGENTFNSSGLRGFSIQNPARLNDGSAFYDTPLHNMYKLIATQNKGIFLDILLVGRNAEIKLPKAHVKFKHNSIYTDCNLDLSKCIDLELQNAVYEKWFKHNIVVRHGQEGYYFGRHAIVKYTDGNPYPELLKPIEKNGDSLTVEFAGVAFRHQFIPSEYVHFGVKSLKITTKLFLSIYQHAFDDPKLERLDIDYYFNACGEIFSPSCKALREVHWKGRYNKGQFVQYIPPIGVISNYVHSELLKAFRGTDDWCFFDSSVIDTIFQDRYIKLSWEKEEIRQRELIPIAIDVLRSTPEQFTNGTEVYSKYLSRHIKYARKVCEKLKPDYPEYAEFLDNFK